MDRNVELSVSVDKLRQQLFTLSDPLDSDSLQAKLVSNTSCYCVVIVMMVG